MAKLDISIVVPVFNEQDIIKLFWEKLNDSIKKIGREYEIIFVNDGSTDETSKIIREIKKKDEHLVIIELRKNYGQTAALDAGFHISKGDIIIAMDADLQHDPADIPNLLKKIDEGYDLVSGWRKDRVDNLWLRRIPSSVANWLVSKISGIPIHDFGTTFKAYRKRVIKNIELYGQLHRFLPVLASTQGVKICEVPIKNIVRPKGKSKYGLGRTLRVLLDLIFLKFFISYLTKPLLFMGSAGLLISSFGFLIFFALAVFKYARGIPIIENIGTILAGIVCIILGVQLVMTGLLGEILVRIYYRTHNRRPYSIKEVYE